MKLRVSPGAKSTAIKGKYREGAIRLSVAAPPVGGRANAEVERYLARLFGASPSEIAVVEGASSRDNSSLCGGASQTTPGFTCMPVFDRIGTLPRRTLPRGEH